MKAVRLADGVVRLGSGSRRSGCSWWEEEVSATSRWRRLIFSSFPSVLSLDLIFPADAEWGGPGCTLTCVLISAVMSVVSPSPAPFLRSVDRRCQRKPKRHRRSWRQDFLPPAREGRRTSFQRCCPPALTSQISPYRTHRLWLWGEMERGVALLKKNGTLYYENTELAMLFLHIKHGSAKTCWI